MSFVSLAFKLLATASLSLAAAPCRLAQSQPPSRTQTPTQAPTPAQAPAPQDETLERLRVDYAMRFMEPEPHMALAKYFRDHGNRLEAFYVLETARRGRFEEDEFNAAFKTYFLGEKPFDNSREAEARLLERLAREPESRDAVFALADIYISRDDWPKAKEYLNRLVGRGEDLFRDAQALAEVHRRAGEEREGETVLEEWARRHPETAEAYRLRAARIPEDETAKFEALMAEAARKFPKDASFPFALAGLRLRQGRLKEAETLYVRAAELAPDSAYVQAWVGRFFFKAAPDDRRALDYYLNAYLLDPHAYETEFVESRIPQLDARLGEAGLRAQLARGVPLPKLLEDPRPSVVLAALGEMGKRWRPEYLGALVGLMAHDDGGVRWAATELLKTKADASFDPTLASLLEDKDLRRRGLAAYVAVHRWKARGFEQMRRMLGEEAELLRFDAVSALILEGGPEGRRVVLEHAAREKNPRLKKLMEKAPEP